MNASSVGIDPERARAEWTALREQAKQLLSFLGEAPEIDVGPTPRDQIFREDKVTLYRYRALSAARHRPSVLICYALVNRPYMLDLQNDRSLIRGLLERGLDVFLIDWGYPDGADRFLDLHDYVDRYLHHCVEQVCRVRDEPQITLLGICQGGTLALCYTALHPEHVKNLVTMVTPVDFHTPADLLSKWVRHVDINALVDVRGNVSGDFLNAAFLTLTPFRLLGQKYVSLLDMASSPEQLRNFLRMEKWIFDSPDQPGEMFRQFVTWFYQENRLVKGTLSIGGRTVDLRAIRQPVLNLYGTQDHLVPPDASRYLGTLLGSQDYREHVFAGGHIGIYVSSKAQREIPSAIADWTKERVEHGAS